MAPGPGGQQKMKEKNAFFRLLVGFFTALVTVLLLYMVMPPSSNFDFEISHALTMPDEKPQPVNMPASNSPEQLTVLSITEGQIFVLKAGASNWIAGVVGMTLDTGDTIKAGEDSTVTITFFDGSTIQLDSGTEVKVLELNIDSQSGATTIELEQGIGNTISRIKKLTDPASRYEIKTPGGVASVRGSVMVTIVLPGGQVTIGNASGTICFKNLNIEVCLPVGTQSTGGPKLPPGPPVSAPWLLQGAYK